MPSISKTELENLIDELEKIPIAYNLIRDIHIYLLHKLDECVSIESAKPKRALLSGLTPPSDLFKDS